MLTALASIMTGTSLFIAKLRKISDFGVCSADSSQALPGSQSDGSNNNSLKKNDPPLEEPISKPISVNYHFHRVCNYNCGFCFHTNTNSFKLSLDDAKAGLRKLQEAGMKKVNFSGGEPFLHAAHLGEMVKFCKLDLKLESVSIVSNGSLIKKTWFEDYAQYLDILAISCDSFDHATNVKIGRSSKKGDQAHTQRYILEQIGRWCEEYNVKFKINSVINKLNWEEDMSDIIQTLKPCRWKCFQVLAIDGENAGTTAQRDVDQFVISSEQFEAFVERHRSTGVLVPEPNDTMRNSYLILDEKMCFLNCTQGRKDPSASILDVDVSAALAEAGFDEHMFRQRDGQYEWSKHPPLDGHGPRAGVATAGAPSPRQRRRDTRSPRDSQSLEF